MKKQKNENVSYLSEVLDKLKEHKMAMVGLVVLIVEILMVVFLPMILKLDPYTSDYTAFSAAPGGAHILGTDAIGRDVFARLMYGGRTSLLVGFVSTLISCAIGVPLGLVAGYAVSEKEYVESARAIGTSNFKIVTKYVLPNSFAPILIAITFQMASAILSESSLSFLGMGVQPPGASWGNMLYDAQSITVLSQKLWIWLPPGLALLITVLSINFLGDGIRDALDPKIKL